MPVDSEGFMRRECPTCERELKWVGASEGDASTPAPEGGYFCPYCAVQAPANAWWTKDQLKAIEAKMHNEVIKPQLDDLGKSLERSSTQHVKFTSKPMPRTAEPQLTESDDMRRIDFGCHTEPVKVLEDWNGAVHCPLCGEPAAAR